MGNLPPQEKKLAITVREGSQDSSDAPYVEALGEVKDLGQTRKREGIFYTT